MNEPLSIITLVSQASVVVQLVMITLLLASLISWVLIFQRGTLLSKNRRRLSLFEEKFWSGIDLNELYKECEAKDKTSAVENVFVAGMGEFGKLRQSTNDPEVIMEGTQRAMRVAIVRESEELDNHLPLLATIGSTSPYIGLFGTVWGIMHSFQGLASVKQATIATVAPGISEALVATAMGLFAAIPAVIFYNRYANRADKISTGLATFADEFSALLHRQAVKLNQQR